MKDFKEDKKYLLLLKEELEINIKVLNDYINFAKANNLKIIDTRKRRNIKFKTDNWEKYKGEILSINNSCYSKEISDIYRMFFMIDNLQGYLPIEAPKETLDKIEKLLKKAGAFLSEI